MGIVQIYLDSKTSSGMDKTTSIYYLLDPLDDLVLGGVAGQPLVEVGDDVDADVAKQVLRLRAVLQQVAGLHHGQAGGDEEGEDQAAQHFASICAGHKPRFDQEGPRIY